MCASTGASLFLLRQFSPLQSAMAPKKNPKQEALRLEIEERLAQEAQADDVETKRLVIEQRLIAGANADDKAIADEIARIEAEILQRLEAERRKREAAQARRRIKIEQDMVAMAQEEDAAEEARREAVRLEQERHDLRTLSHTLCDQSTATQRAALTACWDRIASIYSSWGDKVSPGSLSCGARLAQASVRPEDVRALVGQLMRGQQQADGLEAPPHGVDFRLLDVLLRRGGFSDLVLKRDDATLVKMAKAVDGGRAREKDGQRPHTPPSSHPLSYAAAFEPKPRPYPPVLQPSAPAWRMAPKPDHVTAARPAPPPVKGRVNPSLYASPPHRGIAIREARHNPRFSYWPHDGGPAAIRLNPTSRTHAPPPPHRPTPKTSTATRPASAQVRPGAQRAKTLPRVQALPRPSSAPPSHAGLSPLMANEMYNIVYAL